MIPREHNLDFLRGNRDIPSLVSQKSGRWNVLISMHIRNDHRAPQALWQNRVSYWLQQLLRAVQSFSDTRPSSRSRSTQMATGSIWLDHRVYRSIIECDQKKHRVHLLWGPSPSESTAVPCAAWQSFEPEIHQHWFLWSRGDQSLQELCHVGAWDRIIPLLFPSPQEPISAGRGAGDVGWKVDEGIHESWLLPTTDWASFGVCDGDLQVIGENLWDFVNLLTQTVTMQVRDMEWDQLNSSNREFVQ
jgi:hypothetical protein